MKYIKINESDNVVVAIVDICKDEEIEVDKKKCIVKENILRGHKMSIYNIRKQEKIFKYGVEIGCATEDIQEGQWVHTHNTRTNLNENSKFVYAHKYYDLPKQLKKFFKGYRRENGTVGIRNEIWIIPTVGCVNSIANKLVLENQHLIKNNIEGLYAYTHPLGCSQMGEDHENTKKILTSLAKHPNAGAVLILGLGCENLTMEQFKTELGLYDSNRIKFLNCQEYEEEIFYGGKLLSELAKFADRYSREDISVSELVIGMKCGGSDGLSGITANPLVGLLSDKMIALNGTCILTEVPEMFGAEQLLLNRCINEEIFSKANEMIVDFKEYFLRNNQVVYENPSPGNKEGGITTLEDKSCGCIQKGGQAQISDVLKYGERLENKGLVLLSSPGNDIVSTTALTAAGAHIILFTTGRGTPFGAPIPTVKIASNNELFNKKNNWIDFNAGTLLNGESLNTKSEELLEYIISIASGTKTKNEINNYREISIFKNGVTL